MLHLLLKDVLIAKSLWIKASSKCSKCKFKWLQIHLNICAYPGMTLEWLCCSISHSESFIDACFHPYYSPTYLFVCPCVTPSSSLHFLSQQYVCQHDRFIILCQADGDMSTESQWDAKSCTHPQNIPPNIPVPLNSLGNVWNHISNHMSL